MWKDMPRICDELIATVVCRDKVGCIHIQLDHMLIKKNTLFACSNNEKNIFANSICKDSYITKAIQK